MSGATGTGDFLGPRTEVLGAFQNTVEDATDQGDTLGQGTWGAATGDTPFSDEADGSQAGYTDGGIQVGHTISDEGDRSGPDLLITGTVVGAKYIGRFRRGSGSGTAHNHLWGRGGSVTSNTLSLEVALGNFLTVSENATYIPTANTHYAAHGFNKGSGGREIYSSELSAFLLHVQPTLSSTLADMNFPDQNYYLGPFGT
jgi:hypothetical protein